MTTQEISKLETVIMPNSTHEAVIKVCQSILNNRLQHVENIDYSLRLLLKGVINGMDFPLRYKTIKVDVGEKQNVSSAQNKRKIAYACLIIIALLLLPLGSWKAIVAGVVILITSYLMEQLSTRSHKTHKESKLVLATTIEELSNNIDAAYTQISKFYDYRQIEGKYIDFLIWLQRQYSESEDENFKKSITKLANRFDYSFCEYSDELCECFETSTAHVDSPVTTLYAVMNSKSNKVICKGFVVFPM